jgi:hypothetical protein
VSGDPIAHWALVLFCILHFVMAYFLTKPVCSQANNDNVMSKNNYDAKSVVASELGLASVANLAVMLRAYIDLYNFVFSGAHSIAVVSLAFAPYPTAMAGYGFMHAMCANAVTRCSSF